MKVFSSDCTFDYSWDEVSTANWRKYCPWNDKSTHVTAVDTLSRTVEPSTGFVSTTQTDIEQHDYKKQSLTVAACSVTHRTPYHLPADRPALGSLAPRWRCTVLCLRNLLRRPGVEEGDHVLHKPHLVQRPEREGDCRLSAIKVNARLQNRFQAGGPDHRAVRWLAEHQEQGRRSQR